MTCSSCGWSMNWSKACCCFFSSSLTNPTISSLPLLASFLSIELYSSKFDFTELTQSGADLKKSATCCSSSLPLSWIDKINIGSLIRASVRNLLKRMCFGSYLIRRAADVISQWGVLLVVSVVIVVCGFVVKLVVVIVVLVLVSEFGVDAAALFPLALILIAMHYISSTRGQCWDRYI